MFNFAMLRPAFWALCCMLFGASEGFATSAASPLRGLGTGTGPWHHSGCARSSRTVAVAHPMCRLASKPRNAALPLPAFIDREPPLFPACFGPALRAQGSRFGQLEGIWPIRQYSKHNALCALAQPGMRRPAYTLPRLLRRWNPPFLLAQLRASTVAGFLGRTVNFLAQKRPVAVGGDPHQVSRHG